MPMSRTFRFLERTEARVEEQPICLRVIAEFLRQVMRLGGIQVLPQQIEPDVVSDHAIVIAVEVPTIARQWSSS